MAIPVNPYYTGLEKFWKSPNGGWQKSANALTAGASGYSQGQSGVNDFTIDSFAGLKGSAQGFASGGVYGAIAGGIGAQVGQFSKLNKNLKNLDTNLDLSNPDGSYNSAAYAQQAGNLKSLQEGEDKLGKWGVGDVFDPATKLFGAAFGSRKKIRKATNRINQSIAANQQEYNQQQEDSRNQYLQQQDYYNRTNPYNREYNVYSTRY